VARAGELPLILELRRRQGILARMCRLLPAAAAIRRRQLLEGCRSHAQAVATVYVEE